MPSGGRAASRAVQGLCKRLPDDFLRDPPHAASFLGVGAVWSAGAAAVAPRGTAGDPALAWRGAPTTTAPAAGCHSDPCSQTSGLPAPPGAKAASPSRGARLCRRTPQAVNPGTRPCCGQIAAAAMASCPRRNSATLTRPPCPSNLSIFQSFNRSILHSLTFLTQTASPALDSPSNPGYTEDVFEKECRRDPRWLKTARNGPQREGGRPSARKKVSETLDFPVEPG